MPDLFLLIGIHFDLAKQLSVSHDADPPVNPLYNPTIKNYMSIDSLYVYIFN